MTIAVLFIVSAHGSPEKSDKPRKHAFKANLHESLATHKSSTDDKATCCVIKASKLLSCKVHQGDCRVECSPVEAVCFEA